MVWHPARPAVIAVNTVTAMTPCTVVLATLGRTCSPDLFQPHPTYFSVRKRTNPLWRSNVTTALLLPLRLTFSPYRVHRHWTSALFWFCNTLDCVFSDTIACSGSTLDTRLGIVDADALIREPDTDVEGLTGAYRVSLTLRRRGLQRRRLRWWRGLCRCGLWRSAL